MAACNPTGPVAWVSGLPPGAHPGAGPRLELAVREEGESPFVTLDDSGRTSRVLLGRFAVSNPPSVQVLSYVALKVRREVPSAATAGPVEDNATIARNYKAEAELAFSLQTGLARFDLCLDGAPITY